MALGLDGPLLLSQRLEKRPGDLVLPGHVLLGHFVNHLDRVEHFFGVGGVHRLFFHVSQLLLGLRQGHLCGFLFLLGDDSPPF